jgi:5-methylthioadenosine/S-adenosylhomocysteine deaminase
MMRCCGVVVSFASLWLAGVAPAMDFTIAGAVMTPTGVVSDGALAVTGQTIGSVGAMTSVPTAASAIKVPDAIILPGLIDLHNHLTWNILPRWLPGRKFANRYEWQDSPEYDRMLVAPHNVALDKAACESAIYAEIKALIGGATSTLGSLYPTQDHPNTISRRRIRPTSAAAARGLRRRSRTWSPTRFFQWRCRMNGWISCFVSLRRDRCAA